MYIPDQYFLTSIRAQVFWTVSRRHLVVKYTMTPYFEDPPPHPFHFPPLCYDD